jgi:hypothetical protein
MLKIQAMEIIGGDLSATTKMPCKSFNLPAWECKTGSKLAKIPGTVCHGCYYFRWHDAGDIQSIKHFKNIVEVANKTPAITHWIPTREHKIINDFIKAGNTIPDNLIVRISATNIDGKPPKNASHTSTVHSKSEAIGFECKAPSQSGSCLDCRACWDTNIKNVSYKQH